MSRRISIAIQVAIVVMVVSAASVWAFVRIVGGPPGEMEQRLFVSHARDVCRDLHPLILEAHSLGHDTDNVGDLRSRLQDRAAAVDGVFSEARNKYVAQADIRWSLSPDQCRFLVVGTGEAVILAIARDGNLDSVEVVARDFRPAWVGER